MFIMNTVITVAFTTVIIFTTTVITALVVTDTVTIAIAIWYYCHFCISSSPLC